MDFGIIRGSRQRHTHPMVLLIHHRHSYKYRRARPQPSPALGGRPGQPHESYPHHVENVSVSANLGGGRGGGKVRERNGRRHHIGLSGYFCNTQRVGREWQQ